MEGIISVSKSFDDPAGNGWIESDISERRPKRLEKKTDCKMRLILTQMDLFRNHFLFLGFGSL